MGESSKGRSLRAEKIIDTCAQLELRINDRFPGSGLRIVAGEVLKIARDAMVRSERMQRPNWPLRLGVYLILFAAILVLGWSASALRLSKELTELATFVSVVEATLGSLVFLAPVGCFSSRSKYESNATGHWRQFTNCGLWHTLSTCTS